MKKKLHLIIIIGMILALVLVGCGAGASSVDDTSSTQEQIKKTITTKTVTNNESASVVSDEDGKVKVTTESGEEIEIDTEAVEVVEEEDGSKSYKTGDGKTVRISSDGSASVITETIVEVETEVANTGESASNQVGSNAGSSTASNSESDTLEYPEEYYNHKTVWDDDPYTESCGGDHDWGEDVIIENATCTTTGKSKCQCKKCNVTLEKEIPKLPHDGEWYTVKEATMQEEGLKECICKTCGETTDTQVISKVYNPGQETAWVYDSSTDRHKTMFDGTVVTEHLYGSEHRGYWGYFDRQAAVDMFAQIQYMQNQVYGEGDALTWDESQYEYAMGKTISYAVGGADVYAGLIHMNSGGIPNVSDNRKYITFSRGYGCSNAIACFVIDSAGGADDNFLYGEYWRTYFGTYYSSPT